MKTSEKLVVKVIRRQKAWIVALLGCGMGIFFAAAKAEDCVECKTNLVSTPYFVNRDNPIGLLINDFQARENKLKTPEKIEKYHHCLLSGKQERIQEQSYDSRYRYSIALASESFDVPIAMLTCLCGRESRFNASASNAETSATGICQAMANSLADVERWRNTVPAVKAIWNEYLRKLGKRLENPNCAQQPLSHEVLVRCPSLGLGVAAVYLRYVYSKVERGPEFAHMTWKRQSLQTLVTVAGSYFAGAAFAERALKKAHDRSTWARALMHEVCDDAKAKSLPEDWTKKRMSELRNHMTAIRNCLQEDNWLDHQGNPLGGECQMEPAQTKRQIKEVQDFRSSIPVSCGTP